MSHVCGLKSDRGQYFRSTAAPEWGSMGRSHGGFVALGLTVTAPFLMPDELYIGGYKFAERTIPWRVIMCFLHMKLRDELC
jgi:hypothetical protein